MTLPKNKCEWYKLDQDVFPGIKLIYFNVHRRDLEIVELSQVPQNSFAIVHCREGRMEVHIGNEYCFISPGDLLIVQASKVSSSVQFPLKHCHGLIVYVDLEQTPGCFSCILQGVNAQPRLIAKRFCEDKGYFIARSNPSFEHIFSEMYEVPNTVRQGYLKIKVLELMLFLSVYEIHDGTASANHPILLPAQVKLAKAVAKYLMEHMEERFTLEQASTMFGSSATNIKNCFKTVYGVPFYTFIKAGKMESAAYMLEYTDKSVTQIAGEHGYDNSGKFASAFRAVKGMSPGEYRQQVQKYDNGGDVWKT